MNKNRENLLDFLCFFIPIRDGLFWGSQLSCLITCFGGNLKAALSPLGNVAQKGTGL